MEELAKYCQKIVLINAFENYLDDEQNFLNKLQIEAITLTNDGHDFGMWQRALKICPTTDFEYVLFANDSCILVQPLAAFFDWHTTNKSSFAGMINSNENQYHIQSYFTIYDVKALAVLQRRLRRFGLINNKRRLIKKYEIGISRLMQRKGVAINTQFVMDAADAQNPMFHKINNLLEKGFPFIKKQLLFDGLAQGDKIAFADAGLNLSTDYLLSLARGHSTLQVDWDEIVDDKPRIK